MSSMLKEFKGVVRLMDDVLVFGCMVAEHDKRLKRVEKAGATVKRENAHSDNIASSFLDSIIDQEGILTDPHKIKAMTEMETPKNITRFLGV